MTTQYPQLIRALCDPARYPHPARKVEVLETHISWVLLAGRYAYKIKKPVDLGFLDFSDLPKRRFFCEEELRLNRRLAPSLYLATVAIGGSAEQPEIGREPAIEYAVKMRRFALDKTLDHLFCRQALAPEHLDRLAQSLSAFHAALPPATADSVYGTPAAVMAPVRQNFQQLRSLLETTDWQMLDHLETACETEYAACAALIGERRQQGHIRECHGDLHLGNIVLLRQRPVPFDGIEFAPELRWIDTINDTAFMVMDLLQRGRGDLAYRFLNAYLEHNGDYAGLGLLRFYLSYRATVRAKVAGFRLAQSGDPAAKRECLAYLELASSCLTQRKPALIVMHGLPGSGKSRVAQWLSQRYRLIRLRSDVERKRLFGLQPLASSHSAIGGGIYQADASRQTYDRLLELSRNLLAAGFGVIVDAGFLQYDQRRPFRELATQIGAGFALVSVEAEPATLHQRIIERQAAGNDASEAGLEVLEQAHRSQDALQADEICSSVVFDNNTEQPAADISVELRRQLAELAGLREEP
ncbi:AAA family ATPase [Methylomonas sp. HW2-6]|uniref:bifunctional aminoglycoside phosphotransferase/ATP-binding protein n=1 Tax=Methylomonas sp. HW2-6 TaxID=3376687 RepID=UPI0040433B3C